MFLIRANKAHPAVCYFSRRSSTLALLQDNLATMIKFAVENKDAISLLSPLVIYSYTKISAYRRANNARVFSAVKQARDDIPAQLEEMLKTTNPRLRDSNGDTLMHHAARFGNRKLVNVLVTYGGEPGALNRSKQTPFYEAVFSGQDEIVEDMIRLNQKKTKGFFYKLDIVNQITYSGWTPILAAILNRRTAVIATLIDYDADLFVKNQKGESTLQLAVQNNDIFLVEFILNNSHLSHEQVMALIHHEDHEHHGTPLYIAAEKGFFEIAKLLKNRGASNTPSGRRKLTPLHLAILFEHEKIIRLLATKESLSSSENQNLSVIDCVILKGIQRGSFNTIEEEIVNEYFADLSHRKECYKLAYLPFQLQYHSLQVQYQRPKSLHDAVFWHDQQAIKIFLQANADIEEKNANGETPLFLSGFYNHHCISKTLISNGANIHCINRWGESLLHCLIMNNDLELARIVCEKGINLRYVDSQGYSYLHYVVKHGSTKMASLLLEKGAMRDPRTKNFGNTPLHLAAMLGKVEMVALLLFRYRADPNSRNSCDLTPIQLAKDNKTILHLHKLAQQIQCEADLHTPKLKEEISRILREYQSQQEEVRNDPSDIFDSPPLDTLIYR